MCVCAYVGAWVRMWVRMWGRMCVRSHFAEVSKIVQDATRTGTQRPERPPPNTSDHHKSSTRAGTTTTGTQRTRIAKEIKKTIAN